jgi:DNA-binding transcriptional regulator YiaG
MAKERTLPKRIKSAREALGFSQAQAARKWGFAKQTIQAWEQGMRNPAGLYRAKLECILKRIEGQEASG